MLADAIGGVDWYFNGLLDGDGHADAFYDTALDLTWLRNANIAGRMKWHDAQAWAANLSVGSYADWRLPTMLDSAAPGCDFAFVGTDCGYNVQTIDGTTVYSEVARLFYVTLGNLGARDTAGVLRDGAAGTDWGLSNTGAFDGMQAGLYRLGSEYSPNLSFAWSFDMFAGRQGADVKDIDALYAMAVHQGDIGTPVSEPHSQALLALGLAALVAMSRLRRR